MKFTIRTDDAEKLLEEIKQNINVLTDFHRLLNRITEHGIEYESKRRWKYDNEDYFYLLDTADKGKDLRLISKSSGEELEFSFENEIDADDEEMKTFFQDLICFLLTRNLDIKFFSVDLKDEN